MCAAGTDHLANVLGQMSGYLEAEGWSSSVVLCGPGTDLDDETAKRVRSWLLVKRVWPACDGGGSRG